MLLYNRNILFLILVLGLTAAQVICEESVPEDVESQESGEEYPAPEEGEALQEEGESMKLGAAGPASRQCGRFCEEDYKPVCGSNGKIYR